MLSSFALCKFCFFPFFPFVWCCFPSFFGVVLHFPPPCWLVVLSSPSCGWCPFSSFWLVLPSFKKKKAAPPKGEGGLKKLDSNFDSILCVFPLTDFAETLHMLTLDISQSHHQVVLHRFTKSLYGSADGVYPVVVALVTAMVEDRSLERCRVQVALVSWLTPRRWANREKRVRLEACGQFIRWVRSRVVWL